MVCLNKSGLLTCGLPLCFWLYLGWIYRSLRVCWKGWVLSMLLTWMVVDQQPAFWMEHSSAILLTPGMCVCVYVWKYMHVCVCVYVSVSVRVVCVCVCAHTCACPLCVCLYFVCMCARVYYVICMQLHVCLYLRDVRRTRICVNARFEFTWGKEKKKMRVNKKELASEHDYACVCACFLTNNTSSTAWQNPRSHIESQFGPFG